MDEFLKQLREMLGLSSDASLDEILAALNPILEGRVDSDAGGDADASHRAGSPDPARYVAVGDFQKALIELNSLKMERSREKAEHAVDEAIRSGKLVPALLAGEMHLNGDPRAVRSRSHAGLMLSSTEVAICGLLGVTPNDFLKRKEIGADFLRLNKEHADPNL
jgi:phage I-like protein